MFGFYHFKEKILKIDRVIAIFIILWIFGFLFIPNLKLYQNELANLEKIKLHSPVISKLYLEYCISRIVDRKKCIFSKPFFMLKNRIRYKDNFKLVLNDMGKEFRQTEHFLMFYNNLTKIEDVLKGLPSYELYENADKKSRDKIFGLQRKFSLLAKNSISIRSFFLSLFIIPNLFIAIWCVAIFVLFFIPIERMQNKKILFLYLFASLFISTLFTMFQDNEFRIYITSFSFVSMMLGTAFGYRNKFKFFLNKNRSIHLGTVTVIIFLFQEIILHFYLPQFSEHNLSLLSFVFGYVLSLIFIKHLKENKNFSDDKEFFEWKDVLSKGGVEEIVMYAETILNENPDNRVVRMDLAYYFLTQKTIEEKIWPKVKDSIWYFFDLVFQSKDEFMVISLLNIIPEKESFLNLFKEKDKDYIFHLINVLEENKNIFLMIKMYEVLYSMFSEQSIDIKILEDISREDLERIRRYILNSKVERFQQKLTSHFSMLN